MRDIFTEFLSRESGFFQTFAKSGKWRGYVRMLDLFI